MKNSSFPTRQKAGGKKAATLKLKKILALNIRYYLLYGQSYKSKYFKQWKAFRFTFWISSWIGWCKGIINKLFLFVGPWQLHEVCPFYRRPPLCEVLPGRGSGWEWHPCLEICRRECCLPALPSKLYSGVSKILGWMEMAGERNKGTACLELFLFLTVPFQTTEKKKQQRVREVRSTQVM